MDSPVNGNENDKKNVRFSDNEKRLLHFLFKEYEEIIDIKQRRNNKNYKMSEVRECWQTILKRFNSHHGINERNLKQIQKFWLNSRLRMRNSSMDSITDAKIKARRKKNINKNECSSPTYSNHQQSNYIMKSKQKMYDSRDSNNSISADDEEEGESINEGLKNREMKQELLESKYDDSNEEDQEEAEDTVNETIVRYHQEERNHRLRRKKTKTNRSTNSECSDDNTPTIINQNIAVGAHIESEVQSFQHINHHTLHSPPRNNLHLNHLNSTNIQIQHHPLSIENHLTQQQIDAQINILKLKEYENKLKEQELKCEQQKIELLKSQEELEHLKEMNRLKTREMQLKICLLEEQSKHRRNSKI